MRINYLNGKYYGVDSDIRNIRAHLKYSLTRLGLDYVDIFELARVDDIVNIEECLEGTDIYNKQILKNRIIDGKYV